MKAIIGLALVVTACSSVPRAPTLTPAEQVKKDQEVSSRLSENFEAKKFFKDDLSVQKYLTALASGLAKSPINAKIIEESRWKNFSIPTNLIYVSSGFLKSIEYESELAAGVAFELAHIQKRDLFKRLQDLKYSDASSTSIEVPLDYKENELFGYPDEVLLDDVDAAVEILYRGGFDPRGLISFWSDQIENSGKSGFSRSTLDLLLTRTRKAIATYTPLRNPVVRSEAFLKIKKRIQKL